MILADNALSEALTPFSQVNTIHHVHNKQLVYGIYQAHNPFCLDTEIVGTPALPFFF